ncbi:MAG: hypothetical protein IPN75_16090 [Dechloromonas sp.]|uniref:Uncharacterized protein n=1 Tax=Candidatus Dechloromonas phosphorivorans TaxID=2899244 RepID=A0A9D7QPA5_9RHOO|nr:hypothetical protein [Candidatus Dechloromonas phosphorivorans]
MKKSAFKITVAAATTVASLAVPMAATAQESAEGWKFSLMPYVWLPTIKTTLSFGSVAASRLDSEISVAPNDWLPHMDMAFLLAGEARYGKWLIAGDYVYLNLGNVSSHTNTHNFGPGPADRTPARTPAEDHYLVHSGRLCGCFHTGGHRGSDCRRPLSGLKANSNWSLNAAVTGPNGNAVILPRSGSVSESGNVTAGIVGAKGRVKLGESNWFVPFYVDVGAVIR